MGAAETPAQRHLRKQLKLQLAVEARLGLQTVFRLENDRAAPRPGTLSLLAKALNVTTLWLASGAGPGPTNAQESPTTQA